MGEKSILVVDPDRQWSSELCGAMSRSGRFTVAPPIQDGRAALEHIQKHRPDVIVMEMLLDEYDGLYLAGFIREYMAGYTPLIYILSEIPVRSQVISCLVTSDTWDNIYFAKKPQDTRCVIENITILTRDYPAPASRPFAPRPSGSGDILSEIDHTIEGFLFRLDHRYHMKRFVSAKTALKTLLLEESEIKSMTDLYKKTAEQIGGTGAGVERNLRSFREKLRECNTDYYLKNLADYNINNSSFYWGALRVLKSELGGGVLRSLSARQGMRP